MSVTDRDTRFSVEICPKCGVVDRPFDSSANLWQCVNCYTWNRFVDVTIRGGDE